MPEVNLEDDVPTVHFDEFLPYIAVNVDGVPANVMGHAARLAAIEFAQKTRMIERTMFIGLQAGKTHYQLMHTDGVQIMSLVSLRRCRRHHPLRASEFEFRMPGNLILRDAPDEDEPRALEITAVVAPGQDTCSIDRWVYDRYAETIAAGALSRIFAMPGEDWFSASVATMWGRTFNSRLGQATVDSKSGYSAAPQGIRMPRGFLV